MCSQRRRISIVQSFRSCMFIGIPHFVDKARRFTFMNAPSQDEKMVDRRACGGPRAYRETYRASIRSEYEEEQRRARGLPQAPVAYKNSEVIHSSNKPTNQQTNKPTRTGFFNFNTGNNGDNQAPSEGESAQKRFPQSESMLTTITHSDMFACMHTAFSKRRSKNGKNARARRVLVGCQTERR